MWTPPSRVLCRIEADPTRLFQFLQLHDYPFFWSTDELRVALSIRVMDALGDTLGYVWATWDEVGVLRFHACARKGHHLPLFSSDLMDQLVRIFFFVGADKAVTGPRSVAIARLLRRLGFRGEDGELSLNLWTYHGQEEQEQHRRGNQPQLRQG